MRIEQITPELIRQVEKFQSAFNAARFGALRDLPANPYQVEVRTFGNALAVKNNSPQLRGKQRVTGFNASDAIHLDELLNWYRRDGLRCTIQTGYSEMNAHLFRQFVKAGLVSSGSTGAGAWVDLTELKQSPANTVVRESHDDEREAYLDLFQQCFAGRSEENPEYRAIQWAEDSLAQGKRFIAEMNGRPVGFGAMPIVDGIAVCGTAGTLPEFRGRGIQQSLIHRRIVEAQRLGCSLILGGGGFTTTAERNFFRCGFRLIPLGMNWSDTLTGI